MKSLQFPKEMFLQETESQIHTEIKYIKVTKGTKM
jgi:hypothetical protein